MLSDSMPAFDAVVPDDGYRWWYVDGVSDCGNYGLVIIAFIGSVFSPYYYRARQRGHGNPRAHCAVNVASYGPGARAWSMTERGAQQLTTSATQMRVGDNSIGCNGSSLDITIDDRTAPWLQRMRGSVQVHSASSSDEVFYLDAGRRHHWQPIAPIARIDVRLERPRLRWQGGAYVDSNAGARPLEQDFRSWHWSSLRRSDTGQIYYDVIERSGQRHAIALSVANDNRLQRIDAPTPHRLSRSRWGIQRESLHGESAGVIETLEDAPFYTRSLLRVADGGEAAIAMHESLSLQRFTKPWVRAMLPFRMPRITF